MLFGKTKASSSGATKPPTADELLDHYTPEQLRAHWLALGLAQKSVGFSPKPFDPDPAKRDDPRVADPALKEGALLTNVFNRLARSCFYECASNFECEIPNLQPTEQVFEMAQAAIARYESAMHKVELYAVMQIMDEFIRDCNKYWADNIARVAKDELEAGVDVREGGAPSEERAQVLADSFYLLYVCTVLMHPIVPAGTEKIAEMLNFGEAESAVGDQGSAVGEQGSSVDVAESASTQQAQKEFFNWSHIYKPADLAIVGGHKIKQLPPRTDFFRKHDSQYKKK